MRYIQNPAFTRIISGWMFVSLSFLSGCCCNSMIDCYGDKIDTISDHLSDVDFDRFYHPEWDVSRIGQPDWCQSRLNQKLCPEACGCRSGCHSCRSCNHHECSSCQHKISCAAYENTAVTEIIDAPAASIQEETPTLLETPTPLEEDNFVLPLIPTE